MIVVDSEIEGMHLAGEVVAKGILEARAARAHGRADALDAGSTEVLALVDAASNDSGALDAKSDGASSLLSSIGV